MLDDLIDLYKEDSFAKDVQEAWAGEKTLVAKIQAVQDLKWQVSKPLLQKRGFTSFQELSDAIDPTMLLGYAPDKEEALGVRDKYRDRYLDENGQVQNPGGWVEPFIAWRFTRIVVICRPDMWFDFPKPEEPEEPTYEDLIEIHRRMVVEEKAKQRNREESTYKVCGGGKGILVRAEAALDSEEKGRLSKGSLIDVLDTEGQRYCYRKISGTGPDNGWISRTVGGKPQVERV